MKQYNKSKAVTIFIGLKILEIAAVLSIILILYCLGLIGFKFFTPDLLNELDSFGIKALCILAGLEVLISIIIVSLIAYGLIKLVFMWLNYNWEKAKEIVLKENKTK